MLLGATVLTLGLALACGDDETDADRALPAATAIPVSDLIAETERRRAAAESLPAATATPPSSSPSGLASADDYVCLLDPDRPECGLPEAAGYGAYDPCLLDPDLPICVPAPAAGVSLADGFYDLCLLDPDLPECGG